MDVITKLVQAIPVPNNRRSSSNLPSIPEIPGLPIVGNLLQLMERKPHFTFNEWAKTYGPIYSIRAGATSIIVLNSNHLAKEAMVARLSSLSTRKLPSAMRIFSCDKAMVSLSDYDDYYLATKRLLLANVLGGNAQKRHRGKRDNLIENTSKHLHAHLNDHPLDAVNLRRIFQSELFGFALKQTFGKDIVESLYVQELKATLSRDEIFNYLVKDMMEAVIEMDWRDYFPYLKWIPNKRFEEKIHLVHTRRLAVMKALVREASQSNAQEKEADCYLDFLLMEAKTLSAKQKLMLLWEVIISTSDTTAITTEWAMYELAKDHERQDRLQREIINVCGNDKIKEEHLCRLPYLCAVFHETLRKHSPAPITLPKYAHENTQLGGYYVPANTEIAINIYGCNMDNKVWENPKEWKPERFLDEKYNPSDSYNTMAFGGGKRACPGANEAMLISCMTIGRMIQDFEWRLTEGDEENVETKAYTTHKLHPLQAHLKLRR